MSGTPNLDALRRESYRAEFERVAFALVGYVIDPIARMPEGDIRAWTVVVVRMGRRVYPDLGVAPDGV